MRRPIFLAAYLIGMVIVGFGLIVLIPRAAQLRHPRAKPTVVVAAITPVPTPTVAPTPAPTPLPLSQYPSSHLVVPALGINQQWVPLGYLSDGLSMDSPAGPSDLGWYKFTDAPGGDSNSVFSGHVDWYTGAPAIFRGIASLKEGDEIDVSREDGRLRTYHVVSLEKPDQYADATAIIEAKDVPTVTLITCTGDWNPVTHEYSNRLVVIATAPTGG
jgi:LPXTG-site transpeptidase (sortase) family protein